MRATLRIALLATVAIVAAMPATGVFAQAKAAPEMQMKEIALTQKQIDGVLASMKPIQTIEAKQPQDATDKADPKLEAQLTDVVKKNGFSSLGDYSDVTSSIGIVMAGMDPATKTYVGPESIIKKQMADIEADKTMPPKEKAETLSELKEAMGSAASAKPMQGNIDLVAKNFDALSKVMEPTAN